MNRTIDAGPTAATWLELVRAQVESLEFGVVQIVVHQGSVVQIERTEKVRLQGPGRLQANQSTGGLNETQQSD